MAANNVQGRQQQNNLTAAGKTHVGTTAEWEALTKTNFLQDGSMGRRVANLPDSGLWNLYAMSTGHSGHRSWNASFTGHEHETLLKK